MREKMGLWTVVGLMLAISTGVRHSSASVLTLSDFSSEPWSVPAAWLDAQMSFSVSGDMLTLDVSNNTGSPHSFRINRVYFNTTSHVTGLQWWDDPTPGWRLRVSEDRYHVANFGLFDVSLTDGVGRSPHQIYPGETETFVFQILGTGPFADTDFTTELSTPIGHGHIPSLAAAKFVGGGCGDFSAFGDVVPEPCTLSLLILGALVWLPRAGRVRR
ncbi:MAG: hypothetical protein MUP47_06510 [Phycisphaerae bacterium]|nr:hypothetical protein [Phycisphaerae bacterium]